MVVGVAAVDEGVLPPCKDDVEEDAGTDRDSDEDEVVRLLIGRPLDEVPDSTIYTYIHTYIN